jgi:hypothetical protein
MGGESNNRHAWEIERVFMLPNFGGGLKPTHDWHLNIHQDRIEFPFFDLHEGIQAIIDHSYIVIVLLKDFESYFLVDLVVLGQQD